MNKTDLPQAVPPGRIQCLMGTMDFATGYFHERRSFCQGPTWRPIVVFLFSPFPRPAPYFHSHSCEPVLGSVHVGVHHAGRRCHLHIDLALERPNIPSQSP